jgi:mono/diheme cytochrome c family protein
MSSRNQSQNRTASNHRPHSPPTKNHQTHFVSNQHKRTATHNILSTNESQFHPTLSINLKHFAFDLFRNLHTLRPPAPPKSRHQTFQIMIHRLLLSLPFFTASALAQDGGQLYGLYCSACHGADGAGATGGAFPPLADSAWVNGDPDRAIKIVLHGMHGPITVAGKSYNLAMPPQGAMLPDDQIAAILTHVRSSWGNQAGPVSPDLVKTIRAATSERKDSWPAEELLKLHPLPLEKTALRELISSTYDGQWESIPDFSQLKPNSIEEEHDGIVSLQDSLGKNTGFAMKWDGKFEAPVNGTYSFLLDADDAARIIIDGKTTAEVSGIGPMNGSRKNEAQINLTAGTHSFRVEYLESSGEKGILIGWMAPDTEDWKWLTDPTDVSAYTKKPIHITPIGNRPAIYRNFIGGTTPRAIGFGFPEKVNLAYSADHLGPELLWTGQFMDASLHWTDRGVGNQPPAGKRLITLNNSRTLPPEARFRGYKLDPAGNPTFAVAIGNQNLLDSWRATPDSLIRTLTLVGAGGNLTMPVGKSQDGFAVEPDSQGNVTLSPSKPVTVTYRWK